MIQELYNNVKIQHYVYRPTRIHLFCSLKETPFGICTSRRRSSSSLARSTAISAARWAWGSDDVLILIICECNVNIMIDYDCISIYIYICKSIVSNHTRGWFYNPQTKTLCKPERSSKYGNPALGLHRLWLFTGLWGCQGDQGPRAPNNLNPSSKMRLCFWTGAWVVASVSGSVTASARSHWGNVANGPLAPPKNCKYILSGKRHGR